MEEVEIVAGTSKGLVRMARSSSGIWQPRQVHFQGFPVSAFFEDERNGSWWVALSHKHWGPKLHRSIDRGSSWADIPTPAFPEEALLPTGRKASLQKIWCLAEAGGHDSETIWLGTEPGALFQGTATGGFELVRGLWDHPSRQDPSKWFGTGRNLSFIHSIGVMPDDPAQCLVAVSSAGVFGTEDNGLTWYPCNEGLIAAYLPNPNVEVGHDPHRMLICSADPKVVWQQNHCGIFRSTNGGRSWANVTDPQGVANYGFALVIDHDDPQRAWVIPADSDEQRVAPDLALCVCQTSDGGKTWMPLRDGLPQEFCFDIVFRHGFARYGSTMAFGTSTGNVYLSEDDGATWTHITANLARVENLSLIKRELN